MRAGPTLQVHPPHEPRPSGRGGSADADRSGNRRPGRRGRPVPAVLSAPGLQPRASWRRWPRLSARALTGPGSRRPPSSIWSCAGARRRTDDKTSATRQSTKANPTVSPWEKNPYRSGRRPGRVPTDSVSRIVPEAVTWAEQGLWSSAASAFELVERRFRGRCSRRSQSRVCAASGSPIMTVPSRPCGATLAAGTYGRCRRARRPSARIDDQPPHDRVELVQSSGRSVIATACSGTRAKQRRFEAVPSALDPSDPDSPQVDAVFYARSARGSTRRPGSSSARAFRWSRARCSSARTRVVLEAYDDGRLDRLIDRVHGRAGPNIPPAHPRTKIIAPRATSRSGT